MTNQTLDLIKDIVFFLFFLVGTLWMWGIMKFSPTMQANLERTFQRSRKKFKWLFLAGLLLLSGLFIWQYVFGK